ncbi:LysR family transcriptional regulator [Kocuria sp. M1R5S2]|uniref:LysR family transcriptional regulator n=1 Tax=Kocuria rhizosphaerae TaxID=3376285 RepID=UPI00379E9036
MEIRWLESFVAVAEELHFGRAATRLHMAQSPLSQTIRKLEKDVGARLFERNTRSVDLTAAGHALLPHAYRILEEVGLARKAPTAAPGSVYGRVSIGFSGALNHLTLPPLARALRQRHPNISLNLVGRVMSGEAVDRLVAGTLDLAFVGLPLNPGAVATRLIARERLGVVLPSDHPLAERDAVDLRELAEEAFIAMPLLSGSSLNDSVMRVCTASGFRPRVVQEVPDPFIMMTLVSAGVGVSIMTEGVVGIVPAGSVFRPLAGVPQFHDHALAWTAGSASRVLGAVLDVAAEVLPTPGA